MATRIYTTPIQETECIGNSLITINNNYANLDTQVQTLTTDLIQARLSGIVTNTVLSAASFRLSALETKTTNIELSVSQAGYVPLYCIIMYAKKSSVVADFDANGRGIGEYRKFALCDGRSHSTTSGTIITPNLLDRFIVGGQPWPAAGVTFPSSTYRTQDTGGSNTHTLIPSEIPSHNHTATFAGSALPPHTHNYRGPGGDNTGAGLLGGSTTSSDFEYTSTLSATNVENSTLTPAGAVTVGFSGGGAAHNNMPLFYALAYIMRIE